MMIHIHSRSASTHECSDPETGLAKIFQELTYGIFGKMNIRRPFGKKVVLINFLKLMFFDAMFTHTGYSDVIDAKHIIMRIEILKFAQHIMKDLIT